MIKSFAEIDNNLIIEVCNCFEKDYDFIFLREKYPFLDFALLYSILYSTGKYGEILYDFLCQINIDDSKILIISDTHYGSIYENLNYTYDVFNFAKVNGIHTILHGGDIIDANVNPKRGYNPIKQANYFINVYPLDNNIKTYALLGNHDYLAITKYEEIRDIFSSRNDITVLGFKKSYLNWCKNIISLQHEIEKYKLNLPTCADLLSFRGHSHFYHIKEMKNGKCEKIYIPPMCDDPVFYLSNPNPEDGIGKPGFLTAEIDGNNIVVIYYSFASKKIIKENEFIKVLKK